MKILKEKKGITLIALVITIIVLLILAAVTLNLVLGDNGIITKANEAKVNSTEKDIEEELKLKIQENITKNEGSFKRTEFITGLIAANIGYEESESNVVTKNGVTFSIGEDGKLEKAELTAYSPGEWFNTEENEDGTISITGLNYSKLRFNSPNIYNGDDLVTELVIPKKINGKVVKAIKLGFMGYNYSNKIDSINSVILPEGLYEIKSDAFAGFTKLSEIIIPHSVEVIERNAFRSKMSYSGYGNMSTVKVVGYSSKPAGWDNDWCTSNIEVIWNYSE